MTAFEFVFPLFGLLVGLSFAEMLSGLARTLQDKHEIHVGWLTPLLGLLILINLTMIWLGAWNVRNVSAPSSAGVLFILAVGGTYFLAASMVFPSSGANVRDLDEHFMANRKVALLAIAACNLLYLGRLAAQTYASNGPLWYIANGGFIALLVLAALARNRRLVIGVFVVLLAAHVVALAAGSAFT
jgi:hypothetical protein